MVIINVQNKSINGFLSLEEKENKKSIKKGVPWISDLYSIIGLIVIE